MMVMKTSCIDDLQKNDPPRKERADENLETLRAGFTCGGAESRLYLVPGLIFGKEDGAIKLDLLTRLIKLITHHVCYCRDNESAGAWETKHQI